MVSPSVRVFYAASPCIPRTEERTTYPRSTYEVEFPRRPLLGDSVNRDRPLPSFECFISCTQTYRLSSLIPATCHTGQTFEELETMEEPILEAEGRQAHIELLQDSVLIKRQGLLAHPGGDRNIPIKSIASVQFLSPGWGDVGYIQFVLGEKEPRTRFWARSQDPYTVHFPHRKKRQFEELKQAIEQRIAERGGPAEVPDEAVLDATNVADAPVSKVAGGVEVLNEKLKKLAEQNMSQDEDIKFCLVSPSGIGGWSQAIVAVNDRLLVIKPGMAAGTTFGARVTSFYYRDITGIEVNTGLMQGVIEINTPSYQGTAQRDFWSTGQNDNPFYITNCLPISKRDLQDYKPYIDLLRTMIREGKQERGSPRPAQDSGTLVSELEKLASLRSSGVLSEDEFQQAKKRLLS